MSNSPVTAVTPIIDVAHLCKYYRTYRKPEGLRAAIGGLFHRETTEVRAVDGVSFSIEAGEMDFVLLKPLSARFLLTCSRVNLGAASNALIGAGLAAYALHVLPPVQGLGAPLAYLALVACAVAIFYNLLFMLMTVSFWTVKVDGLQVLFDEVLNMAGLPVSVYRGALGLLFSYLLPLGVAATVPAGVLMGRHDPVFYLYAPLFAVASAIASHWLWRKAIGSYTSAGG